MKNVERFVIIPKNIFDLNYCTVYLLISWFFSRPRRRGAFRVGDYFGVTQQARKTQRFWCPLMDYRTVVALRQQSCYPDNCEYCQMPHHQQLMMLSNGNSYSSAPISDRWQPKNEDPLPRPHFFPRPCDCLKSCASSFAYLTSSATQLDR